MLRLLIAAGALALLGCSGPLPTESIESRRTAIYGGAASGPEDDFVIRLEAINAVGLRVDCSGVAVAPRLILTARHCLVHTQPPPFQCGADGELVSTSGGGEFGTALEPQDAKIFVGPGYPLDVKAHGQQMFTTDTPSVCRDDIAFLVIDTPLDLPPVALRLIESVTPGEQVSVIGYGHGDPDSTEQFRKRVSGLTVESVGPEEVDPADDSQTPPRSFAVGRATCPGDSGGPALSEETGALLGTASMSSNDCTLPDVRNFFPRVAPHSALALEAFAAAGAEPWIEGAARPGTEESCADCESASGCSLPAGKPGSGLGPLVLALAWLTMRARAGRPSRARR